MTHSDPSSVPVAPATTDHMQRLASKAMLQEARMTADTAIAPLNEEGTKTPIFWVHSIGGRGEGAHLSRHLGPEQPFYAVRTPSPLRTPGFSRSIENMASHYVDALEATRPQGSIIMGAWSAGGAVVAEMAKQLKARGRYIERLAIADYAPPQAANHGSRLGAFAQRTAEWTFTEYAERPHARLLMKTALGKAMQVRRTKVENTHPSDRWSGVGDPAHKRIQGPEYPDFVRRFYDAAEAYAPSRIDVPVLLFTANPNGRETLLGIRNPAARRMQQSWESLSSSVKTIALATSHGGMLEPGTVHFLARALKRELAEPPALPPRPRQQTASRTPS